MVELTALSNTTMRSWLSLLLLAASAVNVQGFYRAQGTQIVDSGGNPFIPKGISLNGYLFPDVYGLKLYNEKTKVINSPSQAYKKVGELVGNANNTRVFWDAFHKNYLTEKDVKHLANKGFNAVRLPFNYRMLSPFESPGEFLEEGFRKMDQVIAWCKQHGLAVLLDMHSAPGGQSHDGYADPEHSYWYWHFERGEWREFGVQTLVEENAEYTTNTGRSTWFNRKRTADIWREIAARYAEEEAILGYELVNEPYWWDGPTKEKAIRDFYIATTEAIRSVDPNHMVLVEGNLFAEEIDGLLPPWDDNMAIAFHRFWRETGLEDGRVQEYIDAREEHQVPFMLTESGENSNTWMYEIARLMESNNMGWFFKGYKKVDSIGSAYQVKMTDDYRYVIENWLFWHDINKDVDHTRAFNGLMELAEALKTENCQHEPGFFASLLEKNYNNQTRGMGRHFLPGIIQATDYDVGNQGIAYSDAKYKQNNFVDDGPWNSGWMYRNDGVDIYWSNNDEESNGFHVSGISPGEWMKYTVHVNVTGSYRVSFRVAAPDPPPADEVLLEDVGAGPVAEPGGVIQLFGGEKFQTEPMDVPADGSSWSTLVDPNLYTIEEGKITLELLFSGGNMKIAWMNFELVGGPPVGAGGGANKKRGQQGGANTNRIGGGGNKNRLGGGGNKKKRGQGSRL